ncbi:unnamed protein product [Allacma fusca]|uniref:Uncharacterized protein n=1 Tax=Allacma fusca TaxID=39272 RepID=A0A8J2NP13_9HEXA|nr:unnamed protein product [Allacma fusca]
MNEHEHIQETEDSEDSETEETMLSQVSTTKGTFIWDSASPCSRKVPIVNSNLEVVKQSKSMLFIDTFQVQVVSLSGNLFSLCEVLPSPKTEYSKTFLDRKLWFRVRFRILNTTPMNKAK